MSYLFIIKAGLNNNKLNAINVYLINFENLNIYLLIYINIKNAIALATITIKAQYNTKYLFKFFKVGN